MNLTQEELKRLADFFSVLIDIDRELKAKKERKRLIRKILRALKFKIKKYPQDFSRG